MNTVVLELAHRAHTWAVTYAKRQRMPDTLCGMCAKASAVLAHALAEQGMRPKLCVADDIYGMHVYVKLEDHVIDVTAKQFRPFKDHGVVVLHEKEADSHKFYSNLRLEFDSVSELRNYQLKTGWPKNQVALAKPVL